MSADPPCSDVAEWKHLEQERAAIMEYDGGMPRPEAEKRARALIVARFRAQRQREQEVNDG